MNEEKDPQKSVKKKHFFLTKFIIFLSLIFSGFFGFKYLQNKAQQKSRAATEVSKFDNVDSEIFDVADEYKNQANVGDSHDLPDITVDEMKEKGAEFIYQMLLKNQVQINDLREQIQGLRGDFIKYKNQEKIGKMIFTYVDLRQKIFASLPCEEDLKNFEMLSSFDENLSAKIVRLKPLLKDFSGQKKLSKDFFAIIPELIATKNNNPNANLLTKIRHNISKLVVIRRIDGKNDGEADSVIVKTEKFLAAENYQEALNSLLSLDQSYHQILAEFLDELSAAAEMQKLDQEILNYLKSLT